MLRRYQGRPQQHKYTSWSTQTSQKITNTERERGSTLVQHGASPFIHKNLLKIKTSKEESSES